MKKRRFLSFLVILSSSFCLASSGGESQVLAIRAGKIWTLTDGVVTNGVIIVNNGKIQAVGENLDVPEGAKVLDMSDKNVMPGMIESLGWTRTEISAGLSIATVALGLGGPIVAILIRRIGC